MRVFRVFCRMSSCTRWLQLPTTALDIELTVGFHIENNVDVAFVFSQIFQS